jgi:hypothetical protein
LGNERIRIFKFTAEDRTDDSVKLDPRIAARYPFEVRILIWLKQRQHNVAVLGWARDLSENGLGAFVAEQLKIGESVTLQFPLGSFRKTQITAKVMHEIGTHYGFQFTTLSAEQRLEIQILVKGQSAIPSSEISK